MHFCFITTDSITIKMFYKPIGEALCLLGHSVTYIANFHGKKDVVALSSEKMIDLKMKRGLSLFDFVTMPHKLKKIIKKGHFDFICYSTPNASYYVSKSIKNSNIKTSYFQFGLRFEGYINGSIKRKISFHLEKKTCKWSRIVLSLTPNNSLKNIRYGLVKDKSKIGVISNGGIPGVDERVFFKATNKNHLRKNLGFDDFDYIIVCMGRITCDKGYDTIIKAFNNLEIQNKKLIIIGDFDKTDPVSNSTYESIKKDQNIFVTGFIEQPKANNYLNISDVFVHMSKREGFGQSVVEAMACGLPTIVSNIDGPSEVVENEFTGFIIDINDDKELKARLEELYRNPEKRIFYGNNGHKKVAERYSRSKVVDEICSKLIKMAKE